MSLENMSCDDWRNFNSLCTWHSGVPQVCKLMNYNEFNLFPKSRTKKTFVEVLTENALAGQTWPVLDSVM
jgi:hypothetical protein